MPAAGDRIGDSYEIVRRLAVGGMGEVFLARQRGSHGFLRLVVLKVLLPELADEPRGVARFLDEARIAALLRHPNIVDVFEVGEARGQHFIAMEYIDGESLDTLMRGAASAGRRISWGVTAGIAADAALALDYAHHATAFDGTPLEVVHRDVSPHNVMVRLDGSLKVLDFGIARAANREARTTTGAVRGKLAYMSPEQLQGGRVDARTDQYALGVMLWELLSGRRLLEGAAIPVVDAVRLLNAPLPLPSSLVPDVPVELEDLVMRMTARNAAERFETCAAAAAAAERYRSRAAPAPSGDDAGALVQAYRAERGAAPPIEAYVASADTVTADTLGMPGRAARRYRRWAVPSAVALVLLLWAALAARGPASPSLTAAPMAAAPSTAARTAEAPRAISEPFPPPPATEPAPRAPGRPQPVAKRRAAPSERFGFLSVQSSPWASVDVNGRPLGVTPLYRVPLPPGEHVVNLANEQAHLSLARRVTIRPGETTKLHVGP